MALVAALSAALEHEDLILQDDEAQNSALASPETHTLAAEPLASSPANALQSSPSDNGTEGTFRADSIYLRVAPSATRVSPLPRACADLGTPSHPRDAVIRSGFGASIVGIVVLNL